MCALNQGKHQIVHSLLFFHIQSARYRHHLLADAPPPCIFPGKDEALTLDPKAKLWHLVVSLSVSTIGSLSWAKWICTLWYFQTVLGCFHMLRPDQSVCARIIRHKNVSHKARTTQNKVALRIYFWCSVAICKVFCMYVDPYFASLR